MSDNNSSGFINLESFAKNNQLEINIQSIRAEDPKDAQLRRFKEKSLFILTLFLISLSFIGAIVFIIFRPESKNENIVLNGLVAIVMLILGYFRGKTK